MAAGQAHDRGSGKCKVDGKIDSSRGTRRSVTYITGHDLVLIFGGHVGLVDALLTKINAAEAGRFKLTPVGRRL